MNPFAQRMTKERRMALDNVGSIRMTLNEKGHDELTDFESCSHGWNLGQALCAFDLNLFFDVSEATVIEVIPHKRPGKNRVRIGSMGCDAGNIRIDGERWNLYMQTVKVANHWIYKGYSYVQIDILE